MIPRRGLSVVRDRLASASAVVLLGPRQVGKTTLAREVADSWPGGSMYLDLERPAYQRRLSDADAYLRALAPRLVVLDEVHRMPILPETLRGIIDENRRTGFRHGQFLLLGSASLDVAGMSSESLAGRVSYLDLGGVNVDEAGEAGIAPDELWVRGGFPDSLTAVDDDASLRWRQDLIRSYLEREIPLFAPRIPATTMGRLWTMLAHGSGGLFNASRLAQALGVSSPTVSRYVDLLADLGLVRRLHPWHPNTSKRVTKSPKLHVRDSGLLHALLDIGSLHELLGHPVAGQSYEGFVVECLIAAAGDRYQPYHYRTARGDEADLVLVRGGIPEIVVEVKRSTAPSVSAGFHRAVEDLGAKECFVVHPGDDRYFAEGVDVIGLAPLVELLRSR
jgi:predicted AAA+ superfamily ATPase